MPAALKLALTVLAINVAQALIFYALPRWSRLDVYFSVTVPPGFRDTADGRRILKIYRIHCVLHAIIGSILALAIAWFARAQFAIAGILWAFFGCRIAFQLARKRVKPYYAAPTTKRETTVSKRSNWLPGTPLFYLGPFLILAAAAFDIRIHWNDIPLTFPLHRGLNGAVDRWGTRTSPGAYFFVIVGIAICLALLLKIYWIWRSAPRVPLPWSLNNDADSAVRRRIFVLVLAQYGIAVIFSCVAGALPAAGFSAVAPIICLTILILTAALLTQPGIALQYEPQPSGEPTGDYTPDHCWKAGIFYFNREDPALLVERRFGLGYTLNFAHRTAWLISAAIAAVFAFLLTR